MTCDQPWLTPQPAASADEALLAEPVLRRNDLQLCLAWHRRLPSLPPRHSTAAVAVSVAVAALHVKPAHRAAPLAAAVRRSASDWVARSLCRRRGRERGWLCLKPLALVPVLVPVLVVVVLVPAVAHRLPACKKWCWTMRCVSRGRRSRWRRKLQHTDEPLQKVSNDGCTESCMGIQAAKHSMLR